MAVFSLREAAEQAGTSKSTIWRAIRAGRLSATRTDDGGFAIDPAELFRAFPPPRANGLNRYFCKSCGKTFNALTGTPLARLRRKDCWTEFAASVSEGDTVKASAQRSGVAGSTAFRWRHRFLRAVTAGAIKLRGIVEADETFVLSSRKGERNLDRKARKRGGKASKREPRGSPLSRLNALAAQRDRRGGEGGRKSAPKALRMFTRRLRALGLAGEGHLRGGYRG